MKKFLTSVVFLAGVAASGVASAQAVKAGGMYFEPRLNYTQARADGDKVSFRGFGGSLGYQIDQTFGVEVGYNTAKAYEQGETLRLRSFDAALVATYALTPEVSLRGKVGLANTRLSAVADSETKNRLFVGAGLEFPVAPEVSAVVDYRYSTFNSAKLHNVSAGVKVGF